MSNRQSETQEHFRGNKSYHFIFDTNLRPFVQFSLFICKNTQHTVFVECSVVAEEAGYKDGGVLYRMVWFIHLVLNLNKANEMIMYFRKTIKPDFVSILGKYFLVFT